MGHEDYEAWLSPTTPLLGTDMVWVLHQVRSTIRRPGFLPIESAVVVSMSDTARDCVGGGSVHRSVFVPVDISVGGSVRVVLDEA